MLLCVMVHLNSGNYGSDTTRSQGTLSRILLSELNKVLSKLILKKF
jgi:hypothetical protein